MNTKPILFSGPMIRALLEGRKTQTRRPVKPQPDGGFYVPSLGHIAIFNDGRKIECPYGQPGDLIWVRETFQPIFAEGFEHGLDPEPDYETGYGYAPRYVATDGRTEWLDGDGDITDRCKASIHMPRWASRLTLEITDVRVEQLKDIGWDDAMAEGLRAFNEDGNLWYSMSATEKDWFDNKLDDWHCMDPPDAFLAGQWAKQYNPETWMWALTFKVHDCNIDHYIQSLKTEEATCQ